MQIITSLFAHVKSSSCVVKILTSFVVELMTKNDFRFYWLLFILFDWNYLLRLDLYLFTKMVLSVILLFIISSFTILTFLSVYLLTWMSERWRRRSWIDKITDPTENMLKLNSSHKRKEGFLLLFEPFLSDPDRNTHTDTHRNTLRPQLSGLAPEHSGESGGGGGGGGGLVFLCGGTGEGDARFSKFSLSWDKNNQRGYL